MSKIERIGSDSLSLLIDTMAYGTIVMGNPNGHTALIEIYDYKCPYCYCKYHIIKRLIEQLPFLKVRLIPLPIYNHESLAEAAVAITTAYGNRGHREFNDFIVTSPPLTMEGVETLWREFVEGKDEFGFIDKLRSRDIKETIEKELTGRRTIKKRDHLNTMPIFLVYETVFEPCNPYIFRCRQATDNELFWAIDG